MRRLSITILLLLAACRGRVVFFVAAASAPAHAAGRDTIPDSTRGSLRPAPGDSVRGPHADSLAPTALTTPPAARVLPPDTGIVRALYVNRWAAQRPERMRALIALADSTEINALVIDLKDEFGLNFGSKDPMVARNAGKAGRIPDLAAFLDTLKAHHILAIARLVVFKDTVAARVNPKHVIRQPDGSPWRDKKGLTWVDPYDRVIWEFNIRAAEEMGRAGFDEIQFDYIRFPEPYKSLPPQLYKVGKGVPKAKARILAEFLRAACPRIHATGARCTADVFGMVASIPGALEIGQQWSALAPAADVLLPMVYPSHYPSGAFGAAHPNAAPYAVVHGALTQAHRQDAKLGIASPIHVRPWLQAFTLGAPHYGAAQIEEQKRAVYDAGYDSWLLWQPASEYAGFVAALEKTTVSRKKSPPAKAAAQE